MKYNYMDYRLQSVATSYVKCDTEKA